MSAFTVSILYLLIWRIAVLVTGVILVIVGYKLFRAGITDNKGTLEAGNEKASLKIANIAPGTFFALFGTFIIVTIVWRSPAEIVIPPELSKETTQVDLSSGGLILRSDPKDEK